MLSVSITILTVLLVIISLLMILIVLMQRPKQEGLGAAFGGGMMNEALGAHTSDILQKGTVWLSVFFFSISIVLGILYTKEIQAKNNVKVLDGVKPEQVQSSPPPIMGEQPGSPPPSDSPVIPTPAPTTDEPENAETDSSDASGASTPSGDAEPKETPAPETAKDSDASKSSESSEGAPASAGDGGADAPTADDAPKPDSGEPGTEPAESGKPE